MKIFGLQEKGTNFVSEILAGITTFITVAYLPLQCAQLLAGKGIGQTAAYIAICLTAFVGCLVIGFLANQPYILTPSVGMIAFFSGTLLTTMHYTYFQALALVLIAGIIFLLLSVTGLQNKIFGAIPGNLKNALSAGLGIYIALLGLRNAGFLTTDSNGTWHLVDFSQRNVQLFTAMLMFLGIILIIMCKRLNLPAPILLGVIATGVIYYIVGIPAGFVRMVDLKVNFSEVGRQLSDWASSTLFKNFTQGISGLFGNMEFTLKSILTLIVLILIYTLFSSMESNGVIYATARNAGQLDEGGNFGALKMTMLSNSIGTLAGSCFGCPALTVAPESGAGISAGGKTGLTAVTAGIMFLGAIALAPFINLVPSALTACVMLYIGILMLNAAKEIDFGDIGESIPAFVTMIVIPFTSSIIDGIALGLTAHAAINLFTFKFKAINIIELIFGILFAINYFII